MAYYKCGKIFATQNSNTSIETANGAIANFNTSLAMPVLACVAEFSASQASGTPTPSAPIPIVGVDKVNVVCTGKNLANIFVDGKVPSTTTGALVNAGGARTNFIKCLSSEQYTLSCSNSQPLYVFFYDENKGFLNYISLTGTTLTVTTPLNAKYIMLRFGSNTVNNGMLEKGATASTFEPFGTTALINLGGTYYGGEVDAVTGKITKTWNYINLGDLEWFYNSTNGYFYNLTNIMPVSGTKNWLCTTRYLKPDSVAWSAMEDGMAGFGGIQFRVKDSSITSSAQFKQNINGTYLAYELATPETEYASNTAEISTIAGANNCFADTGDVEVKYKKII